MKYLLPALLFLAVLTMFIQKKELPSNAPLHTSDQILAFGDSLTYGFGAPPNKSYPAQLQKRFGIKVINAGINGETSKEGLERLPSLIKKYPSVRLMILCFGGNDILQKKSMSKLKTNLKAMTAMAKGKGIDVLLIAVPDISLFGLSALNLYTEVADEEKVPLITGLLSDILGNPALKSDQIHPNDEGYEKMTEMIYKTLKEYGWL